MSMIRQLGHGLRQLLHGRAADRDAADEVQHYLEESAAEYERSGLSHAAALRAATIELGTVTGARERLRSSGWEYEVETFVADLRYALRRLRRSPWFTLTAAATLALGIGASTTVFSAISPILLEPLPFPHASRIVTIDDRNDEGVAMAATLGTFAELRARARSYETLAVADDWQPSLTGSGDPERLKGQRISADYFRVYDVAPAVGRAFGPRDEAQGGARVAMVSEALVRRRFGGDRSLLGQTIDLDGEPHTIIGIMPSSFANVVAPDAEVWSPLRDRVSGEFDGRAWGHHYKIIGRLAPTATVESAGAETVSIGHAPVAEFPRPKWADLANGLVVRSMQDDVTAPVRPSLIAIAGAVLILLGIAAVNVTNLLLVRGSQRRAELAMRTALGASRGRIVRQLLTESVVLAALGGALGFVVAHAGVRALIAVSPPGLPRAEAIRIDTRVFLFALALTVVIGVLVGLVPALGAASASARGRLHELGRRGSVAAGRSRSMLVVAEVALAVVLLAGAGLLYRSVSRLLSVAPGFDPGNVVTLQVVNAGRAAASDAERLQDLQLELEAVRRVPGVRSAAFTSQLPLSGDIDGYGIEAQSIPSSRGGEGGSALRYAVTPEYFDVMRIPLRAGRLLDATDRPGGPGSVVINESLARRLFGDRNPIGERIRFGPEIGDSARWDHVVGVVGDVKHYSLAARAPDAFYVVTGQWQWVDDVQTLVVRAAGEPAALVPALRRAVWSVDANHPIQRTRTMESFVAQSAASRRFVLLVIETFAVAALVLASVGLYGVIAGGVAERMREIGIRSALGAAPADIVGSIVGSALRVSAIGAIIGIPVALWSTRLLESMLFGISRLDAVTYGGVAALLAIVAMLAAWAPARRAAGVDPTAALRAE